MAARVALAALISLGLALVGVATVGVVQADSSANAAAECSCGSAEASACEGADRGGHLAWNAATWLVALGLVVAAGRRRGASADSSSS